MKSESFIYWLQGMFELCNPETLDKRQTDLIKRHLAMVFIHEIDPAMGGPEMQEALDKAHSSEHSPVETPPPKPLKDSDIVKILQGAGTPAVWTEEEKKEFEKKLEKALKPYKKNNGPRPPFGPSYRC